MTKNDDRYGFDSWMKFEFGGFAEFAPFKVWDVFEPSSGSLRTEDYS